MIIFIDDMGYADIGPFGAEGYATPHLDRMAAEGRVFTDFCITQAVCSASRAGLITGCSSNRVGILGALNHSANRGLGAAGVTIAEIAKQKNYATACFGKWHLGHDPKFLPTSHGFDEYFGLPYSNDMWPFHPTAGRNYPNLPLLRQSEVIDDDVTGDDRRNLTTWYSEHAVDFIERNKDRPVLLYVPHSMVHVPLYISDKCSGKSQRGLFGDALRQMPGKGARPALGSYGVIPVNDEYGKIPECKIAGLKIPGLLRVADGNGAIPRVATSRC